MKPRQHSYLWIFSIVVVLILTVGLTSPVLAADPAWTITKTHVGNFSQGDVDKTYTITVKNSGEVPTVGSFSITDTLPTGLIPQSISSLDPAWTCPTGDITGLTELTCTRSDVLDSNESSVITLVVDVAIDAGTFGTDFTQSGFLYRTVTNSVTVTGGGSLDPATANDTTNILQMPDLRILSWEYWNEAKTEKLTGNLPASQAFWVKMTLENRGGANTGGFYTGVFLDGGPNFGPDHSPLGGETAWADYEISPEGCVYYAPGGVGATERGNYTQLEFLPELPAYSEPTDVYVHIAYPASESEYSGTEYDNIRNGLSAGEYNIVLYADPTCLGPQESFESNNSLGPIPVTVGVPINVKIQGGTLGNYNYILGGGQEQRVYYNVSGGPVVVESVTGNNLVSAIRLQSYTNETLYSFAETMGVSESLLSYKYYFPTYNNTWAPLNSQLRFANINDTAINVKVTIGTDTWTYSVPANSERREYLPVSGGPVIIESADPSKKIIAAIRLQSFANNTLYSFAETMGIPAGLLSYKYYFPTYNNTWAPLNSQLRFANINDAAINVKVTIGTDTWTYSVPAHSERREYLPVSGGPVIIESVDPSKKIIAAIRLQSFANNVLYSFVETMGVPESLLTYKYYFPTYNNTWAPLNSQLRFANINDTAINVKVTIGTDTWTYPVPAHSERREYLPVSGGPVIIESADPSKKIIAAIRLQSFANNILYSFAETMGVPESLLSYKYYFPTYNNTWSPLNSQLRFGVP